MPIRAHCYGPGMRTQFQPGDVVYLSSGGPSMTVLTVHANGSVTCQWFDDRRKLCTEDFPAVTLTKVDRHPTAPIWSR